MLSTSPAEKSVSRLLGWEDKSGVLWMGRALQGRSRLLRLSAVCKGSEVKLLAAAVMGSGSSCIRRSEEPRVRGAEDEAARSGWMGKRGAFCLVL